MQLDVKGYGNYLGCEQFDFKIKKKGAQSSKNPFFAVKEIVLSSGNCVSTKALAWASIYGIKCLVTSQSGRPLGVFLPLDYDKNVRTRVCQYQAQSNEKGVYIAKTIAKSKIIAQSGLLEKYGLEDNKKIQIAIEEIEKVEGKNCDVVRLKLTVIEGHFASFYFKKLQSLFPKEFQFKTRLDHKALDITNNLFNLAYEVLKWEVYKSVLNAHLDPYLGFLHSIQHSKPSLVCDLQEPYRPLIDEFLITYSQDLTKRDLEINYKNKNPRVFLKHKKSSELIEAINKLLNMKINKQRTRKYGKTSKIKTVIKEDIEQLGGFLRKESCNWIPYKIKRM